MKETTRSQEVDIRCPEVNSDDHEVIKVRVFLFLQPRHQFLNRPRVFGLFKVTGGFPWKHHIVNLLTAPNMKEALVMEFQCAQRSND